MRPLQLGSNPELVAGWGAARALCASACLLVRAESEGVRLQALKFLEAAVLLHTAALGAHADEAGVAEGVCPTQPNSFLSASELNRDLRTYLDELQACAARPHAGPFSVVLVSVLANLSRLRPPLCAETLPPLLQLAASLAAAATNAQTASVSHAIKMSGVQLLRSGVQGEWRDRTVAALAALGHEEAAASAMRQAERSMKRERSQVVERCGWRLHLRLANPFAETQTRRTLTTTPASFQRRSARALSRRRLPPQMQRSSSRLSSQLPNSRQGATLPRCMPLSRSCLPASLRTWC